MAEPAACTTVSHTCTSTRPLRWPLAILLPVLLLAWLPGLVMLPPLDRDESRFAEASRQMVETGNYIDIRFARGARYNKPIGIYWLQSAALRVAGPALRGRIGIYRLPSLIGGLLSVVFLYFFARAIAPPKAALLASLLFGTSILVTAESDIATTDAALLATIMAAQLTLMRVYLTARSGTRAAPALVFGGWVAVGLGILLKGPVILAVLAVTALAVSLWDRSFKWLAGSRPLTGAALAAAIVAPWAIAIGLASHGAFYQQSLGHDFAAKILGGQESHGAPPGYYLALVSLTFWPATLLLLPAFGSAITRRRDPTSRYLLAWGAAVWLMFELVPTKLPHYILPAYPALALLAALFAARPLDGAEPGWQRVLRFVAATQFALGAIAFGALCIYLPGRFGGTLQWPVIAGVVFGGAAAMLAILYFLQWRIVHAGFCAVASAVLFMSILAFGVAPQLRDLWLSPRAAELVAGHRGAHDPPVVLDGFVEPSLVFELGGDARIEPRDMAGRLAAEQGGLALVEDRVQQQFLSGLASAGAAAEPLGGVSGFDYSTGRAERITLYRVRRSRNPKD
jgi:4-amino-4-deoxy-L-arabinose transferase-like glycosyltransferase